MTDQRLLSSALTAVERRELRLLSWGLTDGGLTDEELEGALRTVKGLKPALAREQLTTRGALRRYPTRTGELWRSRAAETVRLMASLRQWMARPTGQLLDSWHAARTLVADYNYRIEPKRRPRREVLGRTLVNQIDASGITLSPVQREALDRLLGISAGNNLRLAGFQARSTERILADLIAGTNRGAVVCAGTGTGKTLAFYLPTLAFLAGLIDEEPYTRALLIYPRNVLLKDQFATAFGLCRKLDGLFPQGRKLTVGALYGETPGRLHGRDGTQRLGKLPAAWERRPGGAVCPYLICRVSGCGGPLLWSVEDLDQNVERLRCLACGAKLEPDEIRLTRGSLQDRPPDLLFTNLDQVNRRLCDFHLGRPIGVGASRPPRVVLLDEAHTYEGTAGAHAALTLRRWRHAVAKRQPIVFAGLSATLAGADAFFADLTGLSVTSVAEVSPQPEELEEVAAEYHAALRHDASSGAQLIAVTIQSAMLLRRALDPDGHAPSRGLFGSQVFCFTETLDLVNRLHYQLHDAESRKRLAALRWVDEAGEGYSRAAHRESFLAGQAWDMPRALRHRFAPGDAGATVTRVSSQDPGLDARADIVVATASLEVGYDSDAVGAVIQHKSPRGGAAFLQRVGRAGRPEAMRPWKVIVLSDFGRDRDAFQQVEHLFRPEITASALPRANRYVLRMQACMAMLDWLAAELRGQGRKSVSVWQMCAKPFVGKKGYFGAQRENQIEAVRILESLLADDPGPRTRLARYIEYALREPPEIVQRLLWDPPRPVLRAAVPTLIRRLSTNWGINGQRPKFNSEGEASSAHEPFDFDHPLPEFVPPLLSSNLVLPEVAVRSPTAVMTCDGVELVLSTFVPGNVTMRYAPNDSGSAHWLPPGAFDLQPDRVDGDRLPDRRLQHRPADPAQPPESLTLPVLRPYSLRADRTPPQVSKSSKAMPIWASALAPLAPGESGHVPPESPWASLVTKVEFLTQAAGAGVEVVRAVIGARGQVRRGRNDTQVINDRFRGPDGEPMTLGFEYHADAVRFRLAIPGDLNRLAAAEPDLARRLRIDEFRLRLEHDPALPANFNIFQRRHTAEVFVAAAVAWAENSGLALDAAIEQMRTGDAPLHSVIERAVRTLLRSALVADGADDEEGDEDAPDEPPTQRAQELLEIVADHNVADAILAHAAALVEPIEGPRWRALLRARFVETLGAALLDAAGRLEPAADAEALTIDPLDTDDPEAVDLWLCERSAGGTGVVEAFRHAYALDPHRFFALVAAALAPSGAERVARDAERMLDLVCRDAHAAAALRLARNAVGADKSESAIRELFDLCGRCGLTPTHRFRVMAIARFVQQPAADLDSLLELLRTLLDRWTEVEARHGVEIEPRLVAYLAGRNHTCLQLLDRAVGAAPPDAERDAWAHSRFAGLLWRRGGPLRQAGLEFWQRFTPAFGVDRLLVLAALPARRSEVDLGRDDWLHELERVLANHAEVDLLVPDSLADAGARLHELLGRRLDSGFLRLPILIDAVDRLEDRYRLTVRLAGGLR